MLLQQQQSLNDNSKPKITDEESLIWCLKNANSECINANNYLQIIVDLCSCFAKDIDLVKVIRSQIDFVSDQLSDKSYQSLIHTNDINPSNDEEVVKNIETEIQNLRNTQNLLRKKYRLLSLLRSELRNCRCECSDKWLSSGNVLTHLRKSEFNCKMWFQQIKVIETKVHCNRLSVPFDAIRAVRQLLDTNELNFNPMPIDIDFNNNHKTNNGLKNAIFSSNNCSGNQSVACDCTGTYVGVGFTANEYENETSFADSMKNMQILRYDSLLNVNEENALTLEAMNSDGMNQTNEELDVEVRTFQELHPISSNVGLNYSHEISLMRNNAVLHQEFDYRPNNESIPTINANHFSDDILPQMTAIEIDQILNN